jgi:hypothetical protein
LSRKPKSPAGGETDMRIGVSPAEHELLDLADPYLSHHDQLTAEELLEFAVKAAQAALRARPDTGMGARRRAKALEAAALLLCSVQLQDRQDEAKRCRRLLVPEALGFTSETRPAETSVTEGAAR